ncbi:hypothetical protein Tco_0817573, partial [Tanacetum coccineum]
MVSDLLVNESMEFKATVTQTQTMEFKALSFQEVSVATLSRCPMDVPARIVKLCTLIWELERAGDSGFYVDYLDHLRDNQMKDLEKLCLVADSEVVVLTRFVNIKA